VEKLRRLSRDRSYAKEVDELRTAADGLREGVGAADLRDGPAPRPQLYDGDDPVYSFAELEAWRAYVERCGAYRDSLRCGHCYAVQPKPPLRRMAQCARCRRVRYCSLDCQKQDWHVRHRRRCNNNNASSGTS